MKCLDCGCDVLFIDLDEHAGHDIVPGSFNYEEEIRRQERRIAELTAELALVKRALSLALGDWPRDIAFYIERARKEIADEVS